MADKSVSEKLSELFELFKSGALTIDEYNSLKAKLIGSNADAKVSMIELSPLKTEQASVGVETKQKNEDYNTKANFESDITFQPIDESKTKEDQKDRITISSSQTVKKKFPMLNYFQMSI